MLLFGGSSLCTWRVTARDPSCRRVAYQKHKTNANKDSKKVTRRAPQRTGFHRKGMDENNRTAVQAIKTFCKESVKQKVGRNSRESGDQMCRRSFKQERATESLTEDLCVNGRNLKKENLPVLGAAQLHRYPYRRGSGR